MCCLRVLATSIRVEDRFAGAENFGSWKERMTLLFQELEIWDIVEAHVQPPIDQTQLSEFNKKYVKAKRIILDAIRDHLFPHVTGMRFAYATWESLFTLHQSTNENRKMVSR